MTSPLLLISGFEPFLDVELNPSGELARALADDAQLGVEVVGRVLPVSFADAPLALEEAVAELAPRRPDAILGLGVQRESWFRLEGRARRVMDSKKPDRDGVLAAQLAALGARDLGCGLDLERMLAVMIGAGALRAGISQHAGGYVCERTYRAALELGARIGVPALFLHVPAVEHHSVAEQLPIVRALAAELVRAARAPRAVD